MWEGVPGCDSGCNSREGDRVPRARLRCRESPAVMPADESDELLRMGSVIPISSGAAGADNWTAEKPRIRPLRPPWHAKHSPAPGTSWPKRASTTPLGPGNALRLIFVPNVGEADPVVVGRPFLEKKARLDPFSVDRKLLPYLRAAGKVPAQSSISLVSIVCPRGSAIQRCFSAPSLQSSN